MKVKLIDVANAMDISVAAVSMALNNKKGVSEETRLQVLEVANRLGYKIKTAVVEQASDSKRFIKLLRIKRHGLVVMETAFFAAVTEGIEEQCRKMGYELVVSNIVIDDTDPEQIKREYHDDVKGIITLGTELQEEDIKLFSSINCPKVVLDRRFMHRINTVLMNNHQAANQGIWHFVECGHEHIGYLKSHTSIYNFDSRFRGYQESLKNYQREFHPEWVILLEPTIEGAYRDMLLYLNENGMENLPTAFLADNDNIALGAMNAMKEFGIHIPEDISLIGIDDMPFCKLVSPNLTTIRIFKEEIGRQAVKLLLEEIAGESTYTKKIEIDTELVIRNSVRDFRK